MPPNTLRHELTKAVLEGVAFGLKDSLDILKDMRIEVKEIRVIGGGAKSRAWRQILADVFGQEILGINTNQGGALGAAILAAVGDGLYPSVEEAAQVMIQTLDPVSPSMDQSKVYAEKHKAYQYLYRCLEPFFEIKK
ncbi:sugar (pentulose or hexulose) kinase [Fusibacter tunisiensis]|uniref:Sugar (Pentulose or hexulose) kinase n=2 Tax=Fusibacter tunisiensis TaxID=1008308 RepID=A0ABS2MTJ7_9FIRM|nr:sugar (pentulose or hexulose) kinase [Fusibacter tunisiensis]